MDANKHKPLAALVVLVILAIAIGALYYYATNKPKDNKPLTPADVKSILDANNDRPNQVEEVPLTPEQKKSLEQVEQADQAYEGTRKPLTDEEVKALLR